MEKKIASVLALLLSSLYFALAELGTAKLFPETGILSACSGTVPRNAYQAKASDTLWDNGAACGKNYCVVCNGAVDPHKPSPCSRIGYTFINIAAYCPDCGATIAISKDGFAAIADPSVTDFIKIDYAEIQNMDLPCA